MKKRLILLGGSLILIAVLSSLGILLLKKQQNTAAETTAIGQPIALGATADSSAVPLSSTSSAGGTPTLPADYSNYEQYKGKTDALFRDVLVGSGAEVKLGSKVAINYRGYTTNGKEFDETYNRNQPYLFTEGEHKVILGLEEAAMGMKVGGNRLFIIPPAAGYGDQGHGPIPGGAVLVFVVELVAAQ